MRSSLPMEPHAEATFFGSVKKSCCDVSATHTSRFSHAALSTPWCCFTWCVAGGSAPASCHAVEEAPQVLEETSLASCKCSSSCALPGSAADSSREQTGHCSATIQPGDIALPTQELVWPQEQANLCCRGLRSSQAQLPRNSNRGGVGGACSCRCIQ